MSLFRRDDDTTTEDVEGPDLERICDEVRQSRERDDRIAKHYGRPSAVAAAVRRRCPGPRPVPGRRRPRRAEADER